MEIGATPRLLAKRCEHYLKKDYMCTCRRHRTHGSTLCGLTRLFTYSGFVYTEQGKVSTLILGYMIVPCMK